MDMLNANSTLHTSTSDDTAYAKLCYELYHQLPAISLLIDEDLNIVSINHYGSSQLGFDHTELLGQSVTTLYAEEDLTFVTRNLNLILQGQTHKSNRWECTRVRKDKSHFWVRDTAKRVEGENKQVLLVSEDITETRYLINELEKQAATDPLTGLYNRNKFERHLEQAILSAQTSQKKHALCFIDLDQFKVVNDVCGHIAGDELLRQISKLILSGIRNNDIFARIGGDEFGLLLQNCSLNEAQEILKKILNKLLQHHFSWDKEIFTIGASIGLVAITATETNAEECLKMADSACYIAKEKGRKNIQIYNPDDSEMLKRDHMQKFASRLNHAFENDRFVLYQQKVFPLTSNDQKQHFEILVRMLDEQNNIIPPNAFIPAAEYYGLSTKLDLWVTENTLKYFCNLQQKFNTVCNINLSGKTLGSKEFIEKATLLLKQYQIPDFTVCFEITETAAISNMAQAVDFINHFKAMDCLFALDDFGSGFSSLAYLKTLPVDFLKIDGHFVKNIIQDSMDLALVRAIHQVADIFGIETIAEFVETREVNTVLKGLGIDYGQGYYLHRPEPITNIT
ncbi:MAG: EAL domain-containing protein [Gammaproteobacteria bacterium]|jgi:diguanylate cyclase (GGDEF)-like protein/PAS domain S-box-containing protein|nr:EAL domain-containing protein [Gammaproteobacteria bacterium]MBT3722519.1 EAL domain-containing protein [Gammaproteobacteria bacterium]MBT4196767.1 EAL domain-containing protein [Gammaproteobacteria bacterium]MBT4450821.1 EAL domain-containing protein [Gammaproteobacteria bacterium]MBT4859836.1 EAL domain-containing protein [Gammaproteobacteria bacterium]